MRPEPVPVGDDLYRSLLELSTEAIARFDLRPPLPMGLGDNGDAVAEHDQQMAEYYEFVDRSATNRLRLRLKEVEEPLDPMTMRQLLTVVGIVAALAVWQVNDRPQQR